MVCMILLEYEAKQVLKTASITVPKGDLVVNPIDVPLPTVLKSQVPIGGRGKLGGIKVVETADELPATIYSLLGLDIKGFTPSVLLAEEKLAITKEFYLSIMIDRANATLQLVAHKNGGVEVEANDPEGFLKINLLATTPVIAGEQLAELYDTPGQTFALQDLVAKLHDCFVSNDATLIEINPLVLTDDDTLVAGDCKMTMDDAAAFRHPEWDFEQTSKEVNFVSLDKDGTVATIANGAGLAMATVDAVADAGMRPANFLDVGGGANAASVLAAFRRIMEYRGVKAIVINIFAGITRCDEVARAIIEAREQIADLPPLCIRLAGTNYTEAKVLLDDADISLLPTLKECLDTAKKEVSHG